MASKICISIIAILATYQTALGQTYEIRGLELEFTVPGGWTGQQKNGVYMFSSSNETGMLFIYPNRYSSTMQMEDDARHGIIDPSLGTSIQLESDIRYYHDGIGAEFSGSILGYGAKAFVINLLVPQGGGLTIIAATAPQLYSDQFRRYAEDIMQSLK